MVTTSCAKDVCRPLVMIIAGCTLCPKRSAMYVGGYGVGLGGPSHQVRGAKRAARINQFDSTKAVAVSTEVCHG